MAALPRHRPAGGDRHDLVGAPGPDAPDLAGGVSQRLLPADGNEAARDPLQRRAHSVRVVHEVAESGGLGADVTARERVVLVTAHLRDPAPLNLDAQPAVGVAERADRSR